MQISAISSAANFGQSHKYSNSERLSEEEIRQYALAATEKQDAKRKRNVKRMFYSIPIIAGLAAAILHKGNSKVLTKEISGTAGKVAESLKSAGSWSILLASGAALAAGNSMVSKKSEAYKNFRENHSVLSLLSDIAIFTGLYMLAPVGFGKLASKMPNQIAKLEKGVENIAGHINSFKTPKFIKNIGTKVSKWIPALLKDLGTRASANIPDSVRTAGNYTKEFGKVVLSWAPHITLLAALFKGLSRGPQIVKDYYNNYNNLKQQVEEV